MDLKGKMKRKFKAIVPKAVFKVRDAEKNPKTNSIALGKRKLVEDDGEFLRQRGVKLLILIFLAYRWRLSCSPAGINENIMLECSGAGNPRAFRALKDVVRLNHPEMLFL